MSEKFDGVRAYWDGKNMYSKQGNILQVPLEFLNGLPSFALDGEIWLGKGTLEKLIGLLNSNNKVNICILIGDSSFFFKNYYYY